MIGAEMDAEIPLVCTISSRNEAEAVVDAVKRAVRGRVLTQVWPEGAQLGTEPIDALKADEIWPDYVEMYFVDERSGSQYRLSLETYHGSGGSWELVDGLFSPTPPV